MTHDVAVAIEATTTAPAGQDAMTPEQYLVALVAQNIALGEALANLAEAVRADEDPTLALTTADQAMAFTLATRDGWADLSVLAKVLGAHEGHRIINAANLAFERLLVEELARDLPTVASIRAEIDAGDSGGDHYTEFYRAKVTFKDGTVVSFGRDHNADNEFALGDEESLLRHSDEDVASSPENQAARAANVTNYAALFGVEPTREAVLDCLDTVSNFLESYYVHNRASGGMETVFWRS